MLHTATNGMIGVVSHRTQAKVGGSTQACTQPALHSIMKGRMQPSLHSIMLVY
jgi:hypothetical protein